MLVMVLDIEKRLHVREEDVGKLVKNLERSFGKARKDVCNCVA